MTDHDPSTQHSGQPRQAKDSPEDVKGYLLGRTSAALSRLNLQHYLWRDSFSFLLHPSIPMNSTTVLADISAGTAIWLIDLARDWPSAHLDGFDLDPSQAPHQRWRLSNVTIRKWDIFTDSPADIIGKYDVVHVHLLLLVIPSQDPKPVAERLAKLPKPGGYLQWDEVNCRDVYVKKPGPDFYRGNTPPPSPALDRLREMTHAGGRLEWTLDIPNVLAGIGFKDVEMYHFEDRDDMVRIIHEQHMVTMEEFGTRLIAESKTDMGGEFMDVVAGANKEAEEGAALCFPRFVCVAKKSF